METEIQPKSSSFSKQSALNYWPIATKLTNLQIMRAELEACRFSKISPTAAETAEKVL